MKFKNSSLIVVLTVSGMMITSCATSANVVAETQENQEFTTNKKPESNKEAESNQGEQNTTLRNYENVQNKINKVSEFKIIHPEKPVE